MRAYCSAHCLREASAPPPPSHPVPPLARFAVVALGLASLSPWHRAAQSATGSAPARVVAAPVSVAQAPLVYGPRPPTAREMAAAYFAELDQHSWLHPLGGPERRMPVHDSRTFGAKRPGDRPWECRSGHCGVDIGEVWGEPVFAAHHGVVDKVQRGANPDGGGKYVRLSHRDGTVFTQYFHLAAIPKRLRRGALVRRGEVIGLLGDTGIEHSTPHLHFTLSVRRERDGKEYHVDPEPLLALWPLPVAGEGIAVAGAAPGVPRGASGRKRHRGRRSARSQAVETQAAVVTSPPVPD